MILQPHPLSGHIISRIRKGIERLKVIGGGSSSSSLESAKELKGVESLGLEVVYGLESAKELKGRMGNHIASALPRPSRIRKGIERMPRKWLSGVKPPPRIRKGIESRPRIRPRSRYPAPLESAKELKDIW